VIDKDILLFVICSTLLILLFITVTILVIFIAGKQRAEQEIKLEQTKFAFEKELRQAETEVSERILGQFAQELHDNIGQLLTSMHLQIENQKLDYPDRADSYKPIEIYLGQVIEQLRLLSRTLNHDYVSHIGLFAAIQLEVDRLRVLKRFQVHWQPLTGVTNLNKSQELMVFRIFQEIIQNALRHSAAKNIYIVMDNVGNEFMLKVEDDGIGYNVEEIFQSNKASGIRNILKRAKLASLDCQLISEPNKGCSLVLKTIKMQNDI
jgi:signal transduction histidine kinase